MKRSFVEGIVEQIRKKRDFTPQVGIILGSGLNAFCNSLENKTVIPYNKIEGFPLKTDYVGRLVLGTTVDGVRVAAFSRRLHYYEGYTMDEAVLPVRILKYLGASKVILTNAAGAINFDYPVGAFMAITDHINLAPNPMIGDITDFGARCFDMTNCYDTELTKMLKLSAKELDLELFEGVYLQVTGSSFETKAEIRAFRNMGADAVGMSTACECIAANQMGIRVCGLSVMSNLAAGMDSHIDHEQLMEVMKARIPEFSNLITKTIKLISEI